MKTLRRRYTREIRAWDWGRIRAEAVDAAKPDPYERDDQSVGYTYLGSCLSLAPSGKYYHPFACSNVDPCPICKGSGETSMPMRDRKARAEARRLHRQGIWHVRDAPNPDIRSHVAIVYRIEKSRDYTCSRCGGLGSHEAYQDQEWHAALEHVSEEHGLFVGGPDDCDGVDIYVGIVVER